MQGWLNAGEQKKPTAKDVVGFPSATLTPSEVKACTCTKFITEAPELMILMAETGVQRTGLAETDGDELTLAETDGDEMALAETDGDEMALAETDGDEMALADGLALALGLICQGLRTEKTAAVGPTPCFIAVAPALSRKALPADAVESSTNVWPAVMALMPGAAAACVSASGPAGGVKLPV